jgi:gentisate 1,2-dioxygenase
VVIAGTRFVFSQHDIFVAPSWCDFAFRANEDCVIFSYSDRAAQEAMGFHRDDEL